MKEVRRRGGLEFGHRYPTIITDRSFGWTPERGREWKRIDQTLIIARWCLDMAPILDACFEVANGQVLHGTNWNVDKWVAIKGNVIWIPFFRAVMVGFWIQFDLFRSFLTSKSETKLKQANPTGKWGYWRVPPERGCMVFALWPFDCSILLYPWSRYHLIDNFN